jgi:hypothetical protein
MLEKLTPRNTPKSSGNRRNAKRERHERKLSKQKQNV